MTIPIWLTYLSDTKKWLLNGDKTIVSHKAVKYICKRRKYQCQKMIVFKKKKKILSWWKFIFVHQLQHSTKYLQRCQLFLDFEVDVIWYSEYKTSKNKKLRSLRDTLFSLWLHKSLLHKQINCAALVETLQRLLFL